jgi:SET domain-containing protein
MPKRRFRIARSATGLGVFAVAPIRRREYIVAYRGPLLDEEETMRREARDSRYLFTLTKKWTIDGSPRWNLGRYVNHSCRPNAEPITRNGGIVIIALRKIEPEEEITYDYGKDYRAYFFKGRHRCLCEPCRERVVRRRRKMRAERKLAAERSSRRKVTARKTTKGAAKKTPKGKSTAKTTGRKRTARRR